MERRPRTPRTGIPGAAVWTAAAFAALAGALAANALLSPGDAAEPPSGAHHAALFGILLAVSLLVARFAASRSGAGGRNDARGEISSLAAGLAHEIRNPLNTIRFNLRMLAEELPSGAPPQELAPLVDSTAAEAGRLERLLASYLDFARPRKTPELRAVRLAGVVDEAVDFLADEFAAAGVALLPHADPAAPPIPTDPEPLRRALLNILRNAREATGGPGEIRVSCGVRPGGQFIAVEDEGPGVPEHLIERIFEPFYTTKRTGTGLGLAIARDAVESLGGTIRCERGMKGARFVIEL